MLTTNTIEQNAWSSQKEYQMSKTEFKDQPRVENMRAKEASRFMACGVSTLWLWVKQNKIKAYKLSDRVTIFKREELEAFINANVEGV